MDITERIFKLSIDLALTVIFSFFLSMWLPAYLAIFISFIFSHTINFIINAHIYVVLRHFAYLEASPNFIKEYIELLRVKIKQEPSIRCAAVFGSLSRNELRASSDLDVRLIRHPGLINGIRACWFVLRERSRAFFKKFPLDIYVLDNIKGLRRLRRDESPTVIYDPGNELTGLII